MAGTPGDDAHGQSHPAGTGGTASGGAGQGAVAMGPSGGAPQYGAPQPGAPQYVPQMYPPLPAQYGGPQTGVPQSGAPQYAPQQYPPAGSPFGNPPPGYAAPAPASSTEPAPGYPAVAGSNFYPPYATSAPPPSQAMHAQQGPGAGYPGVVMVTALPQVPPGAQPGGRWGPAKYCGPLTWGIFVGMCIFLLPCPLCLCPCDDRQVYYAPDGRVYLQNGVMLAGSFGGVFTQ